MCHILKNIFHNIYTFYSLRFGNYSLLCWDTLSAFQSKRLYTNGTVLFENIALGESKGSDRVRCWGLGSIAKKMETEYRNMSGESHVCGLNSSGYLVCRGSNDFGQIDVPERDALEFFGLALGVEHT
ncbi:putative serine/threonine-protein kinase-like protein CCR3 [Glycine soja]|uniref:Putative serine/threonine-protein kinase-like protein CCR3 n=1 Tax=Glycine soja TaxID=3848 RepID=A0A445KYJ8_GLYSO|nr:putative serine/threonine-protein kinase-like protein CCR3 [Glycine soja]